MAFRSRLSLATAVAAVSALGVGAGSARAADLWLTLNRFATLSARGMQVTISGTVTCPSGDSVVIDGDSFETVGRVQRIATSNGVTPVTCTGAVQAWSLVLTDLNTVPMLPGPANADVSAFDFGAFASASIFGVVILR